MVTDITTEVKWSIVQGMIDISQIVCTFKTLASSFLTEWFHKPLKISSGKTTIKINPSHDLKQKNSDYLNKKNIMNNVFLRHFSRKTAVTRTRGWVFENRKHFKFRTNDRSNSFKAALKSKTAISLKCRVRTFKNMLDVQF